MVELNLLLENKTRTGIILISFVHIVWLNSKLLVAPCFLLLRLHHGFAKNLIGRHLSHSLTKLDKCFIFNGITPSGLAEHHELGENAQKVLTFVQENPGCHIRMIKRNLNLSMGTAQYHLDSLEEMGKIFSERQKFRRFYFPVGTFGNVERNILKVLNQGSAREILLLIIEQKNPTQTYVVDKLKISPGTANWHLSRLKDYGIIRESKEGKFTRYSLTVTNQTVVSLLRQYHPSKWNQWSNRLAELFLSVSPPEGDK